MVKPNTPSQESVKALQLDTNHNTLQWLEIGGAGGEDESQELEVFDREVSEKSVTNKNESIGGISPGRVNKGGSGMSQYTETKIVTFD